MPSTRELRRRIKSTKSTKQITKAMELVSASKMRRASEAALASRPYADRSMQIIQDILHRSTEEITHPLLTIRPVKKVLAIVISSDRGLAGIYNSAVLRRTLAYSEEQKAAGHQIDFITMGRKVETGLLRLGYSVVQSLAQSSTNPLITDVRPLATFIQQAYTKGTYDEIVVIFTHFRSMLVQEVDLSTLLPLRLKPSEESSTSQEFLYEPDPTEVLNRLLPRIIEVELFQCIEESVASEHSARRTAMKNATDNASDMIDDYTLTYNSIRQSAITQEIAEITSGSAALAN